MNIITKTGRFTVFLFTGIAFSFNLAFGHVDERPNIVLIMADDLGRECLESYGGTSYKTPNLNKLAKEGIQFDHCYSTPICTTSRVQIMTGKYNFRNYECFAYLNPNEKTFGHLLKNAGYKTMIAGKWQLNGHNSQPRKPEWQDTTRPQKAGFDEFCLWQVDERKRERYWGADLVVNGVKTRMDKLVYSPDFFADQICGFIERNRKNKFFIYYPMLLTHAPFVRAPNSRKDSSTAEYFADMVKYTDEIVGRIDDKLRQLKLSENTLLIFIGDNGTDRRLNSMANGKNIKGGKALTLNAGIHVPMICKWVGKIDGDKRVNTVVDFTDFFPSFAELAQIVPKDVELDGISFVPSLTATPGRRREFSICHYDCRWGKFPAQQFAYDQNLKVYRDGNIYQTDVDPLETKPLSVSDLDATQRSKVQKFRSRLNALPQLKVESLVPGPRKDHNPEKPNVILLMADDLGWGDVGFNGNKIIQTPNLDEMAGAGMKFNRFYAQSAVCSPTRGSCLTGRHPFRYGIYGANVGHLKSSELTLAELLKKKGYRTGHFGKWHLGTLDKHFSGKGEPRFPSKNFMTPSLAGFDRWFSTEYAVATWDPYNPKNAHSAKHAGDSRVLYWEDGKNVTTPQLGDDSRIIMDRVLPFVDENRKTNTPFLAVVWFHAPHKPVVAGPEHRKLYAEYPENAQHYYGCITAMDEQIGRLRQHLHDRGIAKSTLVCFCSDNGPEGRAPGHGTNWGSTAGLRGRKRSLYEGGIRVPAVIEWPSRVAAGRSTEFPAVTSDYLPTIAEILGCDAKLVKDCDGMSLVRVFDGLAKRHKPIGFMDMKRQVWMDNQFKLITGPTTEIELYDLETDPYETNNLADKKKPLVVSMKNDLKSWSQSVVSDSDSN